MKKKPKNRGQLNDAAYEQIRDMILKGSLAPGARIMESELAQHVGMSRTPVRSALHRLQHVGYVRALDGGKKAKLIVAPLTKEDAREIYHIVGALDGLAAWHASQLPDKPRRALADRMGEINDTIGELGGSKKPAHQRLFDLHGDFHDVVQQAISAPRLKALHGTTKPQADRYRRIYSSGDFGQQIRSVKEHRRIVESIDAGNPEESLCRTQEHWMAAADRLCEIIEILGERGNW